MMISDSDGERTQGAPTRLLARRVPCADVEYVTVLGKRARRQPAAVVSAQGARGISSPFTPRRALPVAVERRLGCVLGVYSLAGAKRAIAMAGQAHDSATVMLHAQLLRVRAC